MGDISLAYDCIPNRRADFSARQKWETLPSVVDVHSPSASLTSHETGLIYHLHMNEAEARRFALPC
jgi:hypothetical protein